jgi:hypothetical protein
MRTRAQGALQGRKLTSQEYTASPTKRNRAVDVRESAKVSHQRKNIQTHELFFSTLYTTLTHTLIALDAKSIMCSIVVGQQQGPESQDDIYRDVVVLNSFDTVMCVLLPTNSVYVLLPDV